LAKLNKFFTWDLQRDTACCEPNHFQKDFKFLAINDIRYVTYLLDSGKINTVILGEGIGVWKKEEKLFLDKKILPVFQYAEGHITNGTECMDAL